MSPQSLYRLLTVGLLLFAGACRKPTDVKSNVAELEKAFQAPANAAPGPATAAAQTSDLGVQDLVKTALASARADDYASGVIALQAAQRKPGVTAEQLMVVQRTMQAMTTDLATRSANGDPKALAQLKAIEQTRSQ